MSVHVTQEANAFQVTSTPVRLTLNTNVTINALKVVAWEVSVVDGRVYQIDEHYEDNSGVWIDVSTIVNVDYFSDSSNTNTWFTDGSSFYYWANGSYYYSDGSVYNGPTSNWTIANTTINNSTAESWSFSVAYEYTATGVFVACTKATKITNTGTLVIKYYRGAIEIFPQIVEDVLPPSVYKWRSITIASGEVFDSRSYPFVVAGGAASLRQARRRKLPTGAWAPPSRVTITFYRPDGSVDSSDVSTESETININAHGGQESIDKDWTIAPVDGAIVKLRVRRLEYPLTQQQNVSLIDPDMVALDNESSESNGSLTAL